MPGIDNSLSEHLFRSLIGVSWVIPLILFLILRERTLRRRDSPVPSTNEQSVIEANAIYNDPDGRWRIEVTSGTNITQQEWDQLIHQLTNNIEGLH